MTVKLVCLSLYRQLSSFCCSSPVKCSEATAWGLTLQDRRCQVGCLAFKRGIVKLQGNRSPAEQDLTSCQAAMSCLVLADGLRESVGGHTKMDIKLLEVSSMTYQIR